jgi:hypothetical protein
MSRLRPSVANVAPVKSMTWTNNGTGETMECRSSMNYPITLYYSYAISLQSPPEYPIPLTPTRLSPAACW